MFQLISNILQEFRSCFKRKRTWQWFMVAIIGFMIQRDNRGVTSIITALKLKPRLYHNLLHFFRTDAYQVGALSDKWIEVAMKSASIKRVANRVVLLGDHSKVSKEGLRMPDVTSMYQDS